MTVAGTPSPVGRRPPAKPRRGFETWSWFFMRLSGLVLLFLALLHFAITHVVNDVVDTDAAFVGRRWDNVGWRLFDWTLLALALAHGLIGLRWIIDDYVRPPGTRRAVKGVLYGSTALLFTLGTFTIVTFD